MNAEWLFVYGTLRRAAPGPPSRALAESADFVAEGFFRGILYALDGYPGAVPSANPNDMVLGEVYRLREPTRILPELDAYEGCDPKSAQPTEFARRRGPIVLRDGTQLQAWIYLYSGSVAGRRRIESGDYLEPWRGAA